MVFAIMEGASATPTIQEITASCQGSPISLNVVTSVTSMERVELKVSLQVFGISLAPAMPVIREHTVVSHYVQATVTIKESVRQRKIVLASRDAKEQNVKLTVAVMVMESVHLPITHASVMMGTSGIARVFNVNINVRDNQVHIAMLPTN